MMRSLTLVTFCALGVCATAQKAPTARQFHFDDYRTVVHLDMRKLRSTGVWDELNMSAIKMVLGMMKEQLGFSPDELDSVTMTVDRYAKEGDADAFAEVVVLEGNAAFDRPADLDRDYEREAVGACEVYKHRWGWSSDLAIVSPKLHVYAPAELLREVIGGKPRTGLPSADVMAFTAGQKDVVAYCVLDLAVTGGPGELLAEALPDVTWPEGDKPLMACFRVRATGEDFDPHLTLEMVLRHGTPGEGLAVTEKAVAARLAEVMKMPEARLFKPLLKKVEHERSGSDAVWRVDVGRARNAAGMLGGMAPFLFVARTAQAVPAAALQAVEVEETEEEAEEPAAKNGKQGEKKKDEKKPGQNQGGGN